MQKKIRNILKLAKIYKSYKKGRTTCDYMPLRIWLEPTDRCNLACPLCLNYTIPEEKKGNMEWGLFTKIIDQLEGEICDINLFHRGEPLMHPKITDMVSYIKDKGLNTRMHSNATNLTKEMSKKLLTAGLDYISFSFDGFDKKTYEENRVNAKYEVTMSNILDFLKIKKQLKAKGTFVVLQIIDTGYTKDTYAKEKFLQNFKDLPLDKISVRTPHNWAGGISVKEKGKPKKPIVCTFPWYGLTIFRDGRVVTCCQDYNGEIFLGDANKETLADIWNRETMQKLRKNFVDRKYNIYNPCTNCDRIWRKKLFGVPTEYIGTFIREAKIR